VLVIFAVSHVISRLIVNGKKDGCSKDSGRILHPAQLPNMTFVHTLLVLSIRHHRMLS